MIVPIIIIKSTSVSANTIEKIDAKCKANERATAGNKNRSNRLVFMHLTGFLPRSNNLNKTVNSVIELLNLTRALFYIIPIFTFKISYCEMVSFSKAWYGNKLLIPFNLQLHLLARNLSRLLIIF